MWRWPSLSIEACISCRACSLPSKPCREESARQTMGSNSAGGAAMHHDTGSGGVGDVVRPNWARETVPVQSEDVAPVVSSKAIIRNLFGSLEQNGIRYCHWKSNIRLQATLAAAEDIDLLVDQRDADLFHTALLENGFKLAQSRSDIGHPGVFHALGLEESSVELVHVHAYFQIVSGDSCVKTYRLPIERLLLE